VRKSLLISLLVISCGFVVIRLWGGLEKIEESGRGLSRTGLWSAPGSTESERLARTGGVILIAFGSLGAIVSIVSRNEPPA
jgi:hypothetical protein